MGLSTPVPTAANNDHRFVTRYFAEAFGQFSQGDEPCTRNVPCFEFVLLPDVNDDDLARSVKCLNFLNIEIRGQVT